MDICEHDEYTGSEGSDSSDCDSDLDPSYSILEDTQTQLSNLSIKKKSKSRIGNDLDKERDPEEEGLKIIESGKLEKLKVEQCKAYLRKHGLRLTGNKDTLIHRIKEHQEILNVGGEQKYPVSSFVLNCKGDACMGDVVMFEQNIYEMYNIASRSAGGPPCGTRIVAGRIVKESYGAAKQQHTFTIEVLWSKGEKPLPPLYPLLIKGRNLYRLKTMRQRWEDEEERCNVLLEKHLRGYLARDARETRVQKKETRKKILEGNRALKKEKRNDSLFQLNSRSAAELGIEALQPGAFSNGVKMDNRPQQPAVKSQRTGSSVDTVNLGSRIQHLSANHLQSDSFVNPIVATSQYSQGPGFRVENRMITFQHEQPKQQGMNDKYYGVQCNLVNHSGGFQGFQQPSSDNLGSILSSFCIDQYSRTTWEKELSKVAHHNQPFTSTDIYHRQPLTSFNNYHCTSLPDRRYYQQKQLCKFYAQGRCKFGGNCKFLHDLGEDSGPRKEERRYYHSRPER